MSKTYSPRATLLCRVSAATILAVLASSAAAQTTPTVSRQSAAGTDSPSGLEELIVTARRTTENIQKVPQAVSAFSAATLEERGVSDVRDLQTLTPGVVFGFAASAFNTNYTIRGQSRAVTGEALPTVVTYVNEVPLITSGSTIPVYDLENIQILKGPQGTLFGRNTTGGAVLIYTKRPDYEYGGYAKAIIGDYNWHEAEGAVNIPIVRDKVAIRIAGSARERNGTVENLNTTGNDFDAINDESLRISLLFEPTEKFRNLTIADHYSSVTDGTGAALVLALPDGPTGRLYNCKTSVYCDLMLALEFSKANPRRILTQVGPDGVGGVLKIRNRGLANITTLDFDNIQLKSILGYRKTAIHFRQATGAMAIPNTYVIRYINREQFSGEFQASGKFLNDKMNWLAGVFSIKDQPSGPWLQAAGSFRDPINVSTPGQQSYFVNKSKAVYGRIGLDLSDFIHGLSVDGSYRYTWDSQSLCSAVTRAFLGPLYTEKQCPTVPGALNVRVKSKAPTWQMAASFQATDTSMFYATYRRGYRGGGANTPAFATTGSPGLVRDLSPYQGFQPEYVTDLEVGVKSEWSMGSWRNRLNVAAFKDKYEDIQIAQNLPINFDGNNNLRDDPANNFLQLNTGQGSIKGFEVQFLTVPNDSLSLDLGLAYTSAKITDLKLPQLFSGLIASGTSFSATPKWSGSASIRYVLPVDSRFGQFTVNWDQYYQDKVFYVVYTAPSYTTTNVRLTWREREGSPLEASVFVDNLFDKLYMDSSASTQLQGTGFVSMHYGPPRIVAAQLKYQF